MPYKVVSDFEKSVAEYAGSKYAVAVDSCTNALFLCCKFLNVAEVTIPCRTYVSVPGAIINSGGKVKFEDSDWEASYQLKPYPIYDAALVFNRGMYESGSFWCVSFSHTKAINIGKGGMILLDDEVANKWFRLARYMGRQEIPHDQDNFQMIGWNMYMTPEQGSRGLWLMSQVADQNPVKKPCYQDLSQFSIFHQ